MRGMENQIASLVGPPCKFGTCIFEYAWGPSHGWRVSKALPDAMGSVFLKPSLRPSVLHSCMWAAQRQWLDHYGKQDDGVDGPLT